jgi:hypothetical protein
MLRSIAEVIAAPGRFRDETPVPRAPEQFKRATA